MTTPLPVVVVAGHICLDLIPTLAAAAQIVPGALTRVGPATVATGGAVANTGIALHRLGLPVRLVGKVGDDALGRTTLAVLNAAVPEPARSMVVAPGETSSYTVVISPPDADRSFLHCPGANDSFGPEDVSDAALAGATHFHFGYPPLMQRMFEDGGHALGTLLEKAKHAGLTTSLDMAMPDPQSAAGRADWPAILRRALPHVDFFLPSFDELRLMLRLPASGFSSATARETCTAAHALGADRVVLKCGPHGLVLSTTDQTPPPWRGLRLHTPCFRVQVAGTTGSGDAAIAGFLAAVLRGLPPSSALETAAATGAYCCEHPDATSGIPAWEVLQTRIHGGWDRR